jgi:radical SAM superfamily enzyme with C-terminal helix-hairpin-helix motif
MLNVSILDGYVDEPTCLGVPPYIGPYPRYIAGAVWCYDKTARIFYVTIDQIRNDNTLLKTLSESDLIVVIAGMSVPGRYLSGFPASPNELISFLSNIHTPIKILTGPAARYGFGISGGKKVTDIRVVEDIFDGIADGDGEIIVSELLKNNLDINRIDTSLCRPNPTSIKEFAIRGASIVQQHPFFPDHLITEIETYRGCARSIVGGCSFCSEPSKGISSFRSIKDIIDEVQALYTTGIRHFRIGSQPSIFSYMSK